VQRIHAVLFHHSARHLVLAVRPGRVDVSFDGQVAAALAVADAVGRRPVSACSGLPGRASGCAAERNGPVTCAASPENSGGEAATFPEALDTTNKGESICMAVGTATERSFRVSAGQMPGSSWAQDGVPRRRRWLPGRSIRLLPR
jgi:hypothetical protein